MKLSVGSSKTALRRHGAAMMVVVIICTAAAAILVSDPVRIADRLLHDAGIWATNSTSPKPLGRVNAELGQLEVGVSTAKSASLEVFQHDADVMVVTPTTGKDTVDAEPDPLVATFAAVETLTPSLKPPVALPANSRVAFGGGAVATLNGPNVWYARSVSEFESNPPKNSGGSPLLTDAADARLVAGVDGSVYVYQRKEGRVRVIRDGAISATLKVPVLDLASDLTVVGDRFVALGKQQDRQVLAVSGRGAPVDLGSLNLSSAARLQQPSGSFDAVYIAGNTKLVRLPLDGGDAVQIAAGLSGNPVPPVALGSCVTGAWEGGGGTKGTPFHSCDGNKQNSFGSRSFATAHKLRVRTNRSVAMVNDVTDGTIFGVRQGDVFDIQSDVWSSVFDPNEADEGTGRGQVPDKCGNPKPTPPAAVNDVYGARVGIPTTLKVMENDKDSVAANCRVMAVTDVEQGPAVNAKIAIANGGQSLIFIGEQRGKVTFSYTLDNGSKSAKGAVTVEVFDIRDNKQAPAPKNDVVTVKAGTSATLNVLANDSDPQGDPLIATVVQPENGGTTAVVGATAAPDGTVSFTAPDTIGDKTIEYSLTDDLLNASTTLGKITVKVVATPVPPTARNDYLRTKLPVGGKQGGAITVDLLANDVHGSGAALRLASAPKPMNPDGNTSKISLNTDGTVSVTPAGKPGKYLYEYQISDGVTPAKGLFRLDLDPADGKPSAPVAGNDLVRMRSDGSALVDVLRNDYDVDGDLLSVTAVEPVIDQRQPNASASVRAVVVDNARVRIDAGSGGIAVPPLKYTITDGTHFVTGIITAFARDPKALNAPPTTVADSGSIRKGGVGEFAVLANDFDPDADALQLVSVQSSENRAVDATQEGVAIVNGDTIRVAAAIDPTPAVLRLKYTVSDGTEQQTGELEVNYLDASGATNSGPALPSLTVRVPRGGSLTRVKLPLAGSDPENDAVTVVGISQAPTLGAVTRIDGATFDYQAGDDTVGTDTFTYSVRDTFGALAEGEVRIAVLPGGVFTDPFAFADRLKVRPGSVMPIRVLNNDSYFGTPTVELVTKPKAGDAQLVGNVVKFTAPASSGVSTTIRFSYRIKVGKQTSDPAQVEVILDKGAPLHQPLGVDDYVDVSKGLSIGVLANDKDVLYGNSGLRISDASPLPAGIRTSPDKRSLIVDPKFLVKTTRGPVSFVYRVTNVDDPNASGKSDYVPGSAVVTIPASSTIPTARTLRKTIAIGRTTTFKAADLIIGAPAGSKVRITGAPIAYFGTAKAVSEAEVSFTAGTKFGGIGSVSVPISVGNYEFTGLAVFDITGNKRPSMNSLPIAMEPDESRSVNLQQLVSDPGDTGHTFELVRQPAQDSKQWSWSLSGSEFVVRTTPNATQGAQLKFEVRAKDRNGAEAIDTATITVTVLPVRAPIVPPLNLGEISLNSVKSVELDPLAQATSFVKKNKDLTILPQVEVDGGANLAKVNGGKSITVTFDPAKGYVGPVVVRFQVQDATKKVTGLTRGQALLYLYDVARPLTAAPVEDGALPPGVDVVTNSVHVNLKWSGSIARGTPIIDWEYEGPGIPRRSCGFAGAERCKIVGLNVNNAQQKQPQIRVRPIIKGGETRDDLWSPYYKRQTPIDVPPPEPISLESDFVDRTSISLAWTTPTAPSVKGVPYGSAIKQYIISSDHPLVGYPKTVTAVGGPGSQQTLTISNLDSTADVDYVFEIKSVNGSDLESALVAFPPVRPVGPPVATAIQLVDTGALDDFFRGLNGVSTAFVSIALPGNVDERGGDSANNVSYQLSYSIQGVPQAPVPLLAGLQQFAIDYQENKDYSFVVSVQNRYTQTNSPAFIDGTPRSYESLGTPQDTAISKVQDEAGRIAFTLTPITALKKSGYSTIYEVFDGPNLISTVQHATVVAGTTQYANATAGPSRTFTARACYVASTQSPICSVNSSPMQATVFGTAPTPSVGPSGSYTGTSYTIPWTWSSNANGCFGVASCHVEYNVSGDISLTNTTSTGQSKSHGSGTFGISVSAHLNVPNAANSPSAGASFVISQPPPGIQYRRGSTGFDCDGTGSGTAVCYWIYFNVIQMPSDGVKSMQIYYSFDRSTNYYNISISGGSGGFNPGSGAVDSSTGAFFGGAGVTSITITVDGHQFNPVANWANMGTGWTGFMD